MGRSTILNPELRFQIERGRVTLIARFDEIEPVAVVRCATADDASTAIAFASRFGLETTPRSGGHCLAARVRQPQTVTPRDVSAPRQSGRGYVMHDPG